MTSQDAADVERAYREYIRAYPKQVLNTDRPIDFDALDFWCFPLMIVAGAAIVVVDRVSFDRDFRARYAAYRADGWGGRVDLDAVAVHIVADDLAVLDGRGTRYRADGSVIDAWDSCYVLRRSHHRWRTVAISDAKPRPSPDQWRSWISAAFGT